MDHEDNDFQSQSFQLAVEENITFSPGPPSYSLPKFDLDDNLQVHLRFDSLVESEVLFGIQSQEENRWIEDYSRESSGLEFSSGATEASISRCNNVWSEATSSESVDLLLKSVGQEEMMIGQAVIEESDNCDRLCSLENQMKPNFSQDSFTVSKTQIAPCVGSVSTLDEPEGQSFGLDKDVVDHLAQVDSTSQTGESGCRVKTDNNFKETGVKVDVNAIKKSEGSESHCDSFRECIQVNSCTAFVQDSANIGELNSDAPQRDDCLEMDEVEISRVEVFSSSQTRGHIADADDNILGNMSNLQKVGSMPQATELSCDAIFTQNTAQIGENEHTISSKSVDTVDQFIVDSPQPSPFMARGENICVAPSSAFSVGTIEDHSIQNTIKSDQPAQGYGNFGTVAEQQRLSEDVEPRLDDRIFMSDTEKLPVKEKLSEGQGNEDTSDHIGDSFNLVVETCSSNHVSNESQMSDDRKEMRKGVELCSSVDCCPSSLLVQSQQISAQMPSNICVAPSSSISIGNIEDHSIQNTSKSDQPAQGYGYVGTVAEQQNLSEDVDHRLDDRISMSDTEKLPAKEKLSRGQGNEDISDHIGDSFKLVEETCSSNHISNEPQMSYDRKEMHKGAELCSSVDCCPSSLMVQSQQISAQLLSNTGSNVDFLNCPDASMRTRFSTDSESGGVASEVVNMASYLDSVQNVLIRSNTANHEATPDKIGLDSPSDVHSSVSSKQEEMGTTISLVDAKESSKLSYVRVTSPESEHDKVSDNSLNMSTGIVCWASSSMVALVKISQNESGSDVAKTDSQSQCSEGLKECSVINDAALIEKECIEICEKYKAEVPIEAEAIRPINEETSGQPLSLALEESCKHIESNELENKGVSDINSRMESFQASPEGRHPNHEATLGRPLPTSLLESSHDIVKDVENNEASETNNGLQIAFAVSEAVSSNGLEGMCGPAAMSEGDAEDHVVEDENYSRLSKEPSCPPSVISCNEISHIEKNHGQKSTGSVDNIDADVIEQEMNIVDEANYGSVTISSCNEASQSDKDDRQKSMGSLNHSDSDTLEKQANRVMGDAVDRKENDTFEDDRSFSFKVLCSSTSVSGLDPMSSDDITDENPQISGKTNAYESTENEHKSEPIDQCTTNEEMAGEATPQNNEQYDGKEHQEGLGIDQNTGVSSNTEQLAVVDVLIDPNPKQNIAAELDRNVVEANKIADPSEKETGSKWKAVSIQPNEFLQTVGLSPTFFTCQIDSKVVQDHPCEFHPITKDVTNGQDALGKTSSVKQRTETGRGSLRTLPISPASTAHVLQAGEVQAVGFKHGSTIKSSAVSTVQTSSLPDLNSLTSSQSLFQPSFTDFQQVQLRAQIFVYGSIIQGTAPDEACMQAAFGGSDGGRREWEMVWRVAVERLHNQKSPLSNMKTPLSNSKTPKHLNIGARIAETTRQAVHQSESPLMSTKFSPVVFTPNMPFSSPIWTPTAACRDGQMSSSMPKGPLVDSSKKFLPLHPPQSPPMRHYVGNTSPWMTQVPSPGTWVVNQNAAFDAGVHHNTLPICETVRVTPVRESSAPQCSGKQQALPSSVIHTGTPSSVVRKSLVMDAKKSTGSPAKKSSLDSKPRKKRRNVASEESGKISFVQSQTDPVFVSQSLASFATTTLISGLNNASSSAISGNSLVPSPMNILSQLPNMVATTTTNSPSIVSGGLISGSSLVSSTMKDVAKLASSVATTTISSSLNVASGSLTSQNSPVSSGHGQILGLGETELRVSFSEKTCGGIEQAKRHAEEAAADAATALRHCQNIWSQLSIQQNSGVVSEIQAKLGSSAVSIAAAAAVAKAAAAVAKVASDAALEAKLMADEALAACKSGNISPEDSLCNDAKNLGRITPSSILKGRSKTNNGDSVLVSAREAAKKRVEIASSAAKRAENLDTVLKAAEMTAEAVSQAGTIIAMGEPLPFTLPELVDAGPECYWKVYRKASEQLVKSNNVFLEETNKDGVESVEEFNEQPNKNDTRKTVESSKGSAENSMLLANDMQSGSVSTSGKESESQKGCSQNELSKTIGVAPESLVVSENAVIGMQNEEVHGNQLVSTSNWNKFEDGSLVEVRSNEEGLRTVWFSARILSSKDGKVLVSYTDHASHEGTSQATEWVLLDDKKDNTPRIRFPHPMSVVKYDGAKKRNREARGDYTWSVDDRVDAWISNCWREGIITEKSKEDESKLTVHFPAQQETSVVRAWDLRPYRFWENGKWIEWCRPGESGNLSHERKPSKKSKLEDEAERKEKTTKIPSITESKKPEAQKSLMLSAKEKVFNAGKNINDVVGKKHTGLQKGSSNVNLNAPKPGKKRKFMDVSKVSKPSIFKSEKSQVLGSVSSRDVGSDSLPSKRKPSSDVAANLQNKGKTSHFAEKMVKNNEKRAGHDNLVNSTPSSVEPRRSNRKIQPTSRLLEGLQSSLSLSKIPAASHDKSTKVQQKISKGRSK